MLTTALLFSSVTAPAAPGDETPHWEPSEKGVIRDPQTAITVARAVWISTHPEMKKDIGSEAAWQSHWIAVLREGVWDVSAKNSKGEPDDGLHIHLSQHDGRVLEMVIIQ